MIVVAAITIMASAHIAVAAMPACRAVSVPVALNAGDRYSQEIGDGLALRLAPEQFADPAARGRRLDGWQIIVVPAHDAAGADRIWPANLPLRFNPWQDIGTTYGLTAAEKLSGDITYRFVWRAAEYAKIAALASDALWPYLTPDPDNAGARYLDALQKLDAAIIRLHPTYYDLGENGLSIRRLALTIAITAPRDFEFPASLAPEPASCPPKPE